MVSKMRLLRYRLRAMLFTRVVNDEGAKALREVINILRQEELEYCWWVEAGMSIDIGHRCDSLEIANMAAKEWNTDRPVTKEYSPDNTDTVRPIAPVNMIAKAGTTEDYVAACAQRHMVAIMRYHRVL